MLAGWWWHIWGLAPPHKQLALPSPTPPTRAPDPSPAHRVVTVRVTSEEGGPERQQGAARKNTSRFAPGCFQAAVQGEATSGDGHGHLLLA